MTPESLLEWVQSQGFAIAIASYFILRLDQKLDKIIMLLEKNSRSGE